MVQVVNSEMNCICRCSFCSSQCASLVRILGQLFCSAVRNVASSFISIYKIFFFRVFIWTWIMFLYYTIRCVLTGYYSCTWPTKTPIVHSCVCWYAEKSGRRVCVCVCVRLVLLLRSGLWRAMPRRSAHTCVMCRVQTQSTELHSSLSCSLKCLACVNVGRHYIIHCIVGDAMNWWCIPFPQTVHATRPLSPS